MGCVSITVIESEGYIFVGGANGLSFHKNVEVAAVEVEISVV